MFDPARATDPVAVPQTKMIRVSGQSDTDVDVDNVVSPDAQNASPNTNASDIDATQTIASIAKYPFTTPESENTTTESQVVDQEVTEKIVQDEKALETPLSGSDLSKIADSLEKETEKLPANATDGAVDETKIVPASAPIPESVPTTTPALTAVPAPDLTAASALTPASPIAPLTSPTTPSPVQATTQTPTPTEVPKTTNGIQKPEEAPGIDPNKAYSTVIEVLKDTGALSQDEANQIMVENVSTGKTFETILEANKFVSEEQLTQAKSVVHKIPFVKISEYGTDPQALTQLPEGVARNYNILPLTFDKEKRVLMVAMKDPLDLSAIDFAEQKSGLKLTVYYAMPSELDRKIAENYSQSLSSEVSAALEQTSQIAEAKALKQDLSGLSGETIREAPITKIVQTIVSFAMKARASDVHIEPQEERTRVRYRIDGILVEKLILPRSVHEAVVSRIKILSGLKIDEKRIPQDGRFNFVSGEQEVDLRVSTLPTIHGEKIVMRLLKKDAAVPALEELGLIGVALSRVKDAIKVPHGIVLVTGPTGSGKTTTLYSVLHTINTPKVNIMTLEDPVEYQMPGINQVQINPQAGLTFASGLRSFLRQDPNIIMVGEIRDAETAELAIQASLTGHLVFSTLHTSSAAGAIPRLLDMGAEPFLLASSMTLTMAQRVLRKINEGYKEEYKPEPAVLENIKKVLGPKFTEWMKKKGITSESEIKLYRGKKDRPQTEPEYKGRVAIFEVMPVSEKIGKLILERKPATEMEKLAIEDGMLLMKQDGYLKALEGVTSIEEVLRVAEI